MTERPPLEPLPGHYGNVVEIGEFRLRQGRVPIKRAREACKHLNVITGGDRRVWCEDCEQDLDPFQVLMNLMTSYGRAVAQLGQTRKQLNEDIAANVRSRAAQAVDKIWRGRSMAPCCPHCRRGLLPEDMLNPWTVSREYESARRNRNSREPTS